MEELNPQETPVARVGAGPRLVAALLDYVLSTIAVLVAAWNGWAWKTVVNHLPGSSDVLAMYEPVEDMLVESGMAEGVMGLLGATALMSLIYPLVEGFTGASPGKWALGLRVGFPDGSRGTAILYLRRFAIKFVRPLLGALAALTGLGFLGVLAGPAGLVISIGTLLLFADHKQALHDKLAGTAVYRRAELS